MIDNTQRLSFLGLVKQVLSENKKGMTSKEIWNYATQKGYNNYLQSTGLTPFLTLSASLGQNTLMPESEFIRNKQNGKFYYYLKDTMIVNNPISGLLEQKKEEQAEQEAEIKGLGSIQEFDPMDEQEWPTEPGVYVLYDISDRPIYIGMSGNIKRRLKNHEQKFWYKRPVVDTAAYIKIIDENLRTQIESILIKFLRSYAILNKQQIERDT